MSDQKPRRQPNRWPDGSPSIGRKVSLKQEVADKILGYIRAGSYIETAVVAAGIAKSTYYNWLAIVAEERKQIEAARLAETPYRTSPQVRKLIKFVDAVEKAMAESEIYDLSKIKMASDKNWQAAAWRLERKYPKRWGRQDKVEMTMPVNQDLPAALEVALERAYGAEVEAKPDEPADAGKV